MNRVFTKIQLPEKFGTTIPGHLCNACKFAKAEGYGGEAFGCWEFYYMACSADENPEYSVDPWDESYFEDRISEIITECDFYKKGSYYIRE